MPRRDTYYNQLCTTKPDYYAQTSHGTILIWFAPDLNNTLKPITTAYYNGKEPPRQFRSHDLSQQKGNALFRKGKDRIYSTDLQYFTSNIWPGSLDKLHEKNLYYLIPYHQ